MTRPEFSTAGQIPILLARDDCNVVIVTDEGGVTVENGQLTPTALTLRALPGVKSVEQSAVRRGCYELNVMLRGEKTARKVEVMQVATMFDPDDDMSASEDLLTAAANLEEEKGVSAVINGSEYCTKATADIAQRLNHDRERKAGDSDFERLPANPVDAVLAFRSKQALSDLVRRTREAMLVEDEADDTSTAIDCGLREVSYYRIDRADDLSDANMPQWIVDHLDAGHELVFKPDNKAGSLAVHKVTTIGQLRAYYERYTSRDHRVVEGGFAASSFLVQPYIVAENTTNHIDENGVPGYNPDEGEFSIEGFINGGKLNILTITRTLLDGMLEEGHLAQADISEELVTSINKSLTALIKEGGLSSGVFHIECRVNNCTGEEGRKRYDIYPIDAALRPPGCTLDEMVKEQTGRNMNELMVLTAFGDAIPPSYLFRELNELKVTGRYFPRVDQPYAVVNTDSYRDLPGVKTEMTFWKKPGEPIEAGTFDERIGAVKFTAKPTDEDMYTDIGEARPTPAIISRLQGRIHYAIRHAKECITPIPMAGYVGEVDITLGSVRDSVGAPVASGVPSERGAQIPSPFVLSPKHISSLFGAKAPRPPKGAIKRSRSEPARQLSLTSPRLQKSLAGLPKDFFAWEDPAGKACCSEQPNRLQMLLAILQEFARMFVRRLEADAACKHTCVSPDVCRSPSA